MALEICEVHVAVRIPLLDMPRLEAKLNIIIDLAASIRVLYVGFNLDMSSFHDKRVRQDLEYAFDKEAIVKLHLGGGSCYRCPPSATTSSNIPP